MYYVLVFPHTFSRGFMTAEQITVIITNVLTSGGALTFIYFLVRSLRREIAGLNKTIEAQNKTLEVMEKRINETEKIGSMYQSFVSDLPKYLDEYKEVIHKTRDEKIAELEKANQLKDDKLKSLTEIELRKLELQEKAIANLPNLIATLTETTHSVLKSFETVQSSPLKTLAEAKNKRLTREAISAIIARNMSHNIGSHVIAGALFETSLMEAFNNLVTKEHESDET